MVCRFLLILLLTGLSLALRRNRLESTKSKLNSVERVGIYRGQNTTIEKHPYLVQVFENGDFSCAGTIVSSSYIITLGSCAYEAEPSMLSIVAGGNDIGAGITYKVKKVIPHPDYVLSEFDYDYAMIKIKGKFTWGSKVGNVSLPSKPPTTHTSLTVAGWGVTSMSGEGSNYTLQQGTMKWQTQEICASYYTDYDITFNDRVGCAYDKGKTTLCDGDYGDPFVKDNVLYGMFMMSAWPGMCSDYAAPVVISNVAPVVDWIQKYTRHSSNFV